MNIVVPFCFAALSVIFLASITNVFYRYSGPCPVCLLPAH